MHDFFTNPSIENNAIKKMELLSYAEKVLVEITMLRQLFFTLNVITCYLTQKCT